MTSPSLTTWRQKTFQFFEDTMQPETTASRVNTVLIILIVLNVFAAILESDISYGPVYAREFALFDTISVMIFSIEFLLRLWVSVEGKAPDISNTRVRIRYLFSPMALVDLLAILPFYISLFFNVDLRFLRLFRVLRILKLTHYFQGFNIFIIVLGKELKSIAAAVMVTLVLITVAASIMYTLESHAQPKHFGSIAQSFWWAVVTMTTVGYGDVTPETPAGRIVAMFVMLLGVGLVALPAGMLAAKFGEELKLRRRNLNSHIIQALSDGEIDADEYKALLQLADKLDLDPDDLQQSIQYIKENPKNSRCPHCHKRLHH